MRSKFLDHSMGMKVSFSQYFSVAMCSSLLIKKNSPFNLGLGKLLLIPFIFISLSLSSNTIAKEASRALPACGSFIEPPIAKAEDTGPRKCTAPVPRTYLPKFAGIGYEVLNIESEACFVPDESYQLLDDIVDEAISATSSLKLGTPTSLNEEQARLISSTIGNILAKRNFGLYMQTDSLGDALAFRNRKGDPETHIIDCDTSSFIYLTIAQNLHLPLSYVEITIPTGELHAFVRWELSSGKTLDWDTNGRAQCFAPPSKASYQGKSLTPQQVIGQVYGQRGEFYRLNSNYKEAIKSFRRGIQLYPEIPRISNNFAWMIATKEFPGRETFLPEALAEAKRMLAIEKGAAQLDTLACMYAAVGDFDSAIFTEKAAVKISSSPEYQQSLDRLRAKHDCIGLE